MILIVFTACYEANHLDIPDKAETSPTPIPQIAVSGSAKKAQIFAELVTNTSLSACEVEVTQLKQELKDWQQFYYDKPCKCEDTDAY